MLEKIRKHKLISGLLSVSAVLVLAGFSWALISLWGIKGSLITHFNDTQGITAAGGMDTLVFAGIFGIAVVFLNGSLALEFDERSTFFGRLTAVLTLVFAILLFIAFAAILSVN